MLLLQYLSLTVIQAKSILWLNFQYNKCSITNFLILNFVALRGSHKAAVFHPHCVEELPVHEDQHHHHEVCRVRLSACSFNLKVKLVPLSFPSASYSSPRSGFKLQFLCGYPVLSHVCNYCSHFRWYSSISQTVFCTPSLSLMEWFLYESNLVIRVLKSTSF